MKILFITPRFPYPPIKGDKLRAYHFIKGLSKNNEIYLCSFIENINENKYVAEMQKYCQLVETTLLSKAQSYCNVLFTFFNNLPLQVNYYYSKEMQYKIAELLKKNKFDIIHVALLRMMPYISEKDRAPVVLDHIDALSLNMRRRAETEKNILGRFIFKFEEKKVADYEKYSSTVCDVSIITSQIDKKAIKDNNNIYVISNGVDIEYFKPLSQKKKDIDLLFTGNMEYFPNINAVKFFCKKVYPLLRKEYPSIKVCITGPNPPSEIRSMADNINFFVTGFVQDIREYLNRAKIFIAPLQAGSGIQNKILEAMAMGLPVVTTSYGNNGITAQNEKEIIVADNPQKFLDKVIDLLETSEKRELLSLNARIFVVSNFSWNKKINQLENIYREIVINN